MREIAGRADLSEEDANALALDYIAFCADIRDVVREGSNALLTGVSASGGQQGR